MILKNELRIGNLVEYDGNEYTVQGISNTCIIIQNSSIGFIHLDKCEQINQILIDLKNVDSLGFIEKYQERKDVNGLSLIHLSKRALHLIFRDFKIEEVRFGSAVVKSHSIHWLQNLYFIHYNQEL